MTLNGLYSWQSLFSGNSGVKAWMNLQPNSDNPSSFPHLCHLTYSVNVQVTTSVKIRST